jgi:hypothetical protein
MALMPLLAAYSGLGDGIFFTNCDCLAGIVANWKEVIGSVTVQYFLNEFRWIAGKEAPTRAKKPGTEGNEPVSESIS